MVSRKRKHEEAKKEEGERTWTSPRKRKKHGKKKEASSGKKKFEEIYKIDGEFEAIRFGANEVVAVYIGDEEGEENNYGFVRVLDDVLFADAGDDKVDVEWFEEKKGNKGTVLVPEEGTESRVAIDSFICSVTVEAVEKLDGSLELPDGARERIEKNLEQQFLDDYDPTLKDEEQLDYEARMLKLRKKQKRLKSPNVKEGKNKSKSTGKGKATKTAATKGKGASRKTSRALNPRPSVEIEKDIWTIKGGKGATFCGDTHRSSKEVIRAVRSGSSGLLKKLIKDKSNVADLFVFQSASVLLNAVHYAFEMEDKVSVELLYKAKDETGRAKFPECTLIEHTSGRHTSQYADYNRYQVAASRGGKEGNNAFMKDSRAKNTFPFQGVDSLGYFFKNFDSMSVNFMKFLEKKIYNNNLFNWNFPLSDLVKSGNRELSEIAMRALLNRGVGLNQLHVDVLGTSGTLKEKPRAVSVTKKSENDSRFCPIHCAATNPNPAYIKVLLDIAPEAIDCLDSHEAGLLHYAAVSEGTSTLKWLLESFASLSRDARTRKFKETPLMWAARACRAENVRLLCDGVSEDDLKKQFKMFNSDGLTALHLAVSSCRSDRILTVRALLDAGMNVDVFGDTRLTDKVTPSIMATKRGDLETLELLVERGADLRLTDKLNRSLAMWAAMNGHVHILSYLIRAGIDVDAEDSSENTALHYAAAYGWLECVELLLKHAKADPRNNWSNTPLTLSLKKGSYACAAVLLKLKDKVDVNVCDNAGRSLFSSLMGTYLSHLSSNKDAPLPWAIKQILERDDLDLSSTDSQDCTVLHHIAKSPNANLPVVRAFVSRLLKRGLNPLVPNKNGDIAASLALRNGCLAFAKTLFDHVSHSTVQIPGGSSLLHLLINRLGKEEDVGLFIELFDALKGTQEDTTDDQGRKPLFLAADILCGATCQQAGDQVWTRMKETFQKLVDRMPSLVTDIIQRKTEFSVWDKVEKRIKDAKGEINWTPSDEYSSCAGKCYTMFHALCSLSDVDWALEMFSKLAKMIVDKEVVKRLINLKSINGKTPVLLLIENFQGFSFLQRQSAMVFLVTLRECGASMNAVTHPLFDSMEDAMLDPDVVMEDDLDTSNGSEEEKLKRVQDFVLQREQKRLRKKLSEKGTRATFRNILQPYIHVLLKSRPSTLLTDALLPHMDLNEKDLDGNNALHTALIENVNNALALILSRIDVNATNTEGHSALTIAAGKHSFSVASHGSAETMAGSSGSVVWEYWLEVGMDGKKRGWHSYDKNASAKLEGFMQNKGEQLSKTSWRLKSGYFSYEVDTNKMTQRNMSSGTVRPIRRVPPVEIRNKNKEEDKASPSCDNVLELLLAAGADLSYKSPFGTALHISVQKGLTANVKILLSKAKSCHVNACDAQGRTPLHFAVAAKAVSAKQELEPIERLLLDAGADVNAKDIHGRTPIFYAFFSPDTHVKCAYPRKMQDRDPLDMLIMLCSVHNIQLDIADVEKRTVLHFAAAVGASICVVSLTERNKELMDAVDLDNNTPFAVALLAEHWDTALLLLSKGSSLDVDVTDVERVLKGNLVVENSRRIRSALWHAVRAKGALPTYMLSADRLPINTVLTTLLQTGCFQKALQQIQQCGDKLISDGPSEDDGMNALHRLGQAPSFHSAPGFDIAIADALIKAGINVEDSCKRGYKAIHIAVFHGHYNLVKHLLSVHGATVDVKDKKGGTPVTSMFTGGSQSEDMLCVLLDASKDALAMASSAVVGSRSRKNDEILRSMADPEVRMFDTPESKRRSKKFLLEKLEKEAKAKRQKEKRARTSGPTPSYVVSSTILIEAVRAKNLRMTNALLSYGADPNAHDEEGRTTLHHAALADDADLLRLLLRWSIVPIDEVDKHGLTPLAYTVLKMLQKSIPESGCFATLLDYGADTQAGKTSALDIAVKNNQTDCALTMLHCARTSLNDMTSNKKSKGKGFSNGDNVWVRFGGACGTWLASTVVEVDGEMLSVVPGKDISLDTKRKQRFLATENVRHDWVCRVNYEKDVPRTAHIELVKHFKKLSDSETERKIMLEKWSGSESKLLRLVDKSHPSVQCILSAKLKVGDIVGRYTSVDGQSMMQIGTIVAKHPNELYDLQLVRGKLQKQLKRTELRTLRKELQFDFMNNESVKSLNPLLVHGCVRPFKFGSFENIDLLRALSDAKVSLDKKNKDGHTPLDLARPGSEMQAFLQNATKRPNGGRKDDKTARKSAPPLDGINDVEDAKAALLKLHESGADTTERVIPPVNKVCELKSEGIRVLKDDDEEYYDVSLTKVDVEHGRYGKYVFYKMQIVYDPVQKLYVLLTNWGRIGEYGKYQQTPYSSKEECVEEFRKIFKSKAGNVWEDRNAFKKQPKKYSLVRTKRTRVKNPEKLLAAIVEEPSHVCNLEPTLAETLRSLLDVDMLMSAFKSSGLDHSQLPLGQLTSETLDKAEEVLREIKQALDKPQSDETDEIRSTLETVAKLTNEYYELLPIGDQVVTPFSKNDHRFGVAVDLISKLRDLNVAKQLLLGAMHRKEELNPVEYVYKALQMKMEPLDADSREREIIERYIDATCTDGVVVNQIYALDNGQTIASDGIGNKRLLFHGSKNFNILAILKQGLRIAPPEAPTTGYMYGKGVYFADQFSKAFGYTSGVSFSSTSSQQPRAYVFVAEVAIGVPYVALQAEYMEAPKAGTHSTLAAKSQAPDPALNVVLDSTGGTVSLGNVTVVELPELVKFKWTSRYGGISAEDSAKIERVRVDPSSKFPAKVRVTWNRKEYEALLENGPFSKEAALLEVKDEEEEAEKKNEPDMGIVQENKEEKATDNDENDDDDSDSDSDPDDLFITHNTENNRTCNMKLERKPNNCMGGYNEFIVYDTKQIRLKYLIELTSPAWVERDFKQKQIKKS